MTYLSTFCTIFQFSVGIFPNSAIDSRKHISVIFTLHAILFGGEIVAFIYTTKNLYRFEIAYQVSCFAYIASCQILSWSRRKLVLDICNRLNGQFPEFMGDDATKRVELSFQKFINTFGVIYSLSMPIYLTAPTINFFATGMNYRDPLSYAMPYWFGFIEVTSVWEYFIMSFVQSFLCTTVFFSYACSFCFIICNMISLKAHLDEIHVRCKILGDKMTTLYDEKFRIRHSNEYAGENATRKIHNQYDQVLVEELLEIIRYKQVYLK